MRRLVWWWVGIGVVAYAAGTVGWGLSHEPGLLPVALLSAGLLAVAALAVSAAIRVGRVVLDRHGRRGQSADGPEADYGDPPAS